MRPSGRGLSSPRDPKHVSSANGPWHRGNRRKAAGWVDQERIFLSAVSGEFRTARESVASTLRGLALVVREQSDFKAKPGGLTLLDKLHDYIKDCSVVVRLIGTRSGSKPTPPDCCTTLEMSPSSTLEKSPVCADHRAGTWGGRHTIDERVGTGARLCCPANCLGTVGARRSGRNVLASDFAR
jgi:hypothetical protein